MKQLRLLKDEPKAYGGTLLKKRKARMSGRPLDTKRTMHLILRSSKARGELSFWKAKNKEAIRLIIQKFSRKYGIKIHSMANVGNHLHFQIKLGNRYTYAPFIRATTAAIAMAVTGASRWSPKRDKFWDYRPYTRVVIGYRALLKLKDYIEINQLEGLGYTRREAQWIVEDEKLRRSG